MAFRRPPNLNESFTVRGEWWLPDNPTDRVPGTLRYQARHEPELEITRCFRSLPARELLRIASNSRRIPILAGQSDDGRYWTAMECLPDSLGTEDSQPVHFYCPQVLSALAPRSIELIRYSRVHIECSRVAEWLRPFPPKSVSMPRVRIEFSTRERRLIKAQVATPQGRLSLVQRFSPAFIPAELTIHSQAQWEYECDGSLSLPEVVQVVRDCQNFATFIIGQAIDVNGITVVAEKSSAVLSEFPGSSKAGELILPLTLGRQGSFFAPEDALFQFGDLGSKPHKVLEYWFAAQKDLREVIAFLLSSYYMRGYVTTEFLTLTQALESLHRRILGGGYYEPDEYEKIRQSLVAALPVKLKPAFKERLKSAYKYGNEFSLRRRLLELFNSLGQNGKSRIASDIKAFTERVVTTRNYLTHLDSRERTQSLVSTDDLGPITRANVILRAVANTLIAKAIGIDGDLAIQRAFKWIAAFDDR